MTGTKGQMFSGDMMSAVFLFTLMAAIILAAWNSSIDRTLQDAERKDMELAASRILDILVRTPGHPSGWENSSAVVVGLAGSDRSIDSAKLDAFIGMDYNETRKIFGIPYNYFFRLGNYTKGVNGSESVYVRRIVMFNGTQFAELELSKL